MLKWFRREKPAIIDNAIVYCPDTHTIKAVRAEYDHNQDRAWAQLKSAIALLRERIGRKDA